MARVDGWDQPPNVKDDETGAERQKRKTKGKKAEVWREYRQPRERER